MARPPVPCSWLRELAAGYLRPYSLVYPQQGGGLWGFFFEREHGPYELGFFAGFLTGSSRDSEWRSLLGSEGPECAVFAFVHPASSRLHQRLVRSQDSRFRRAYELLTKYTVRRPRFEFHEQHWAALVRHVPLAEFPPRQREKYARNFFMETLALVVRTRLPEDLHRLPLRRREPATELRR